MTTGPEHYRTGERLARQAQRVDDPAAALVLAQLATAHATLANAAATALNDNSPEEGGMPLDDYRAWQEAAGVYQPKPRKETD
ncbi:hypothetical protein ACIQU5_27945 [Streptomyces sp. NPDC090306]|uniref:hypothetical protein n=1 Tax=Streptomyces sp. NPDC090306 TaxID=3365961 RepID=UPI0038299686